MVLHKSLTRRASVLLFMGFLICSCDSGTPGPPEAVPVPSSDNEAASPGAESSRPSETVDEAPGIAEPPLEVPDYQIVTRIRTRYLADEHVRPFTPAIAVSSHAGAVRLTGTVDSAVARVRAAAIARATYGVGSVDNQIQAPQASEEDLANGADVPATVMAVEPSFAEAVVNYETGEVLSEILVVNRPVPTDGAPDTSVDEAEQSAAVEPVPETDVPAAEPIPEPIPEEVVMDTAPAPSESGSTRTYTVQSGDTLWTIAQATMGSGARWEELFEANSEQLGGDPNHVRAGMELVVPE